MKIKLSYWTSPEIGEFKDLEAFKNDLSNICEVEIESQVSDTRGGGLYEFVVEIINNFKFSDIAKDYIEDGVKLGLAYFWRPIYKKIKDLFKNNQECRPDIQLAKFIFKDVDIIIYPLYNDSINDNIDDIILQISKHIEKIKHEVRVPIASIHVPIFNKVDIYEVCAYRVKLNIDENIDSFSKEDYFKLWGIRCNDYTDFIYNPEDKHILKTKFHTQFEYDILVENKFNSK